MTQEDLAHQLGVSLVQYRKLESGESTQAAKNTSSEIMKLKLSDLEGCERCLIMRRRWQMTQREVAKELGVSRNWVNQMEQGKVSSLALEAYWNS